ncbi:MAG: DEAD/DEAH box helicase [Bacilli bacterium]|jgi:competence protein ComFA
MESFCCPRCGNKDPRYIGYRKGIPYCRLCLPYNGKEVDQDFKVRNSISLELEYPLSPKQEEVAQKVKQLLISKQNVLIHAVTGAGKTELVYYSMAMFLASKKHVGFATPRKDVVIDLVPRIKEAFPSARTIAVYGGHSSLINGDIIVLTTHQLYRYPSFFDLLIVDEIDAFPYKGDYLLKSFFRRSVRGNYVLLSATPSEEDIKEIKKDHGQVVTLFERYHHGLLPLPVYKKINPLTGILVLVKELRRLVKLKKPVFLFVPTIALGQKVYGLISLIVPNGFFVSSKEEERKIAIQRFKNGELSYLVTTSILERGVTVRDLQVLVYQADHVLYNQAALVQIAGRVGRKIGATSGEVIFFAEEENKAIKGAIDEINRYNKRSHLL